MILYWLVKYDFHFISFHVSELNQNSNSQSNADGVVSAAKTEGFLEYITAKLDQLVEKEPVMSASIKPKCNSH